MEKRKSFEGLKDDALKYIEKHYSDLKKDDIYGVPFDVSTQIHMKGQFGGYSVHDIFEGLRHFELLEYKIVIPKKKIKQNE